MARLAAPVFARLASAPGVTLRPDRAGSAASAESQNAAVAGGVRTLLRFEGVVVLGAALAAYAQFGAGWGVFALWLLAPDLALAGYLAGPRIGAALYNATHSYLGAVALLAFGVLAAAPWAVAGGLIWCAHIGIDRALGFGLRYAAGFGATHLGRLGRPDPW
jgi:hypothetical protein